LRKVFEAVDQSVLVLGEPAADAVAEENWAAAAGA
jgi:hypothetical protein